MAGISSLGVGSGLDLGALVENLVNAERAPTETRLNTRQNRARAQLSAFGTLSSAVSALSAAVDALKSFQTKLKATSATADTVAVSTSGTPDPGQYQVRVFELAAAQSFASDAFDDVETSLGEGTLTMTIGDEIAVIELTEGADSLGAVRDAINASGIGVRAVIVRDGEAHRLLLTAAESGLTNQMTLTAAGTVDTRLATAQMTETVAASDASFSVNGLTLSATSNTVDDVIPGLTLTLKRQTEGDESVSLTVEPDRAAAREKLNAVVNAYSALTSRIRELGRYDAEASGRGPLVGDATLRGLESQIGGAFSAAFDAGEGGAFTRLVDIGVRTGADGKAVVDNERLDEALAADEAGVEALLSAFAAEFSATLDAYKGSGGLLDSRTNGLNGELKRITAQREALDRRMEQVEARLRAQFTALDALVAQFQSTSEFLSGQLAGLVQTTSSTRR
jgi:flagellar hook-associated protein 2